MNKVQSWLNRNWPVLIITIILMMSVFGFIGLRADASFSTISPLLSLIIGGMSTALIQLLTKESDKSIQMEREKRNLIERIRERRDKQARDFFNWMGGGILNLLSQARTAIYAHHAEDNELFKQSKLRIQNMLFEYDHQSDVIGRASVHSIGNPELKRTVKLLEQKMLVLGKPHFYKFTSEEFDEFKEELQTEMFDIIGRGYKILDEILIAEY